MQFVSAHVWPFGWQLVICTSGSSGSLYATHWLTGRRTKGRCGTRFRAVGEGYGRNVLTEPVIGGDSFSLVVSFRQLPICLTVLQSGRLDLSRPGRVQQSVVILPIRAHASAPLLGDIAVGSMLLRSRSNAQAPGPSVSLTLNNAPAKDDYDLMSQLVWVGMASSM